MEFITAEDPESKSEDIVADNLRRLEELVPEAFSEGEIDFDVLKQLLGSAIDEREEKYGLNWHGKRQARKLALAPSSGTLRPAPEESVDWETTQNLMIEGDNLEVLKLLQKSYASSVRMIYIDPPYNSGRDFVYRDDFRDNVENFLELTGQIENGQRITTNTEADGRFHTNWLNMMYPRLRLARSLLSDDGILFVSIDDRELGDLLGIVSEIFGEENVVRVLVWQKKVSPSNDSHDFSNDHEYVVVVAKNKNRGVIKRLPRTEEHNKYYTNPDNDPRGAWNSTAATCNKNADERPNLYYSITNPHTGREVWPRREAVWAFGQSRMLELITDERIYWGADGQSESPRVKNFLSEASRVVPRSVLLYKEVGHTQSATNEFRALMPGVPWDYPKPTSLVRHLVKLVSDGDGADDFIVADFFAGSGTTGHAVVAQNAADGGSRRYICVQLPEPLDVPPFRSLGDITKERLRRAGSQSREDGFRGDVGFRVFRLDSSNIRSWSPSRDDLAKTLEEAVEHLEADRSESDVLYEVLLKLGLDLCVPVAEREIAGKCVESVGGGVLFVCLAESLSREEVEPLAMGIVTWHAELDPASDTTCVFRDSAFADDVAKTNLTAILEQHGLSNVRSL